MKPYNYIKKLLIIINIFFLLTLSSCTLSVIKLAEALDNINNINIDTTNVITDLSKINYSENFITVDNIKEIKNHRNDSLDKINTDSIPNKKFTNTLNTTTNNNNNNNNTNNNIAQNTSNKTENNTGNNLELSNTSNNKKEPIEDLIITNISSINSDYFPDSIIVNLTVKNNNGAFISGLADPYIKKEKNVKDYWKNIIDSCKGISSKIENIKIEEIREIKSPNYSICYVLDHSPSMGEERTVILQQSVRYSISKVKNNDKLSAIKFTDRATVEARPTTDKNIFAQEFKINGMSSKKYGTGTDILKALDSAAALLQDDKDNSYEKIIVLFTDGSSSMKEYNKVIKKLRQQKIRVFTICYGMTDFSNMVKIAKDTDGQMILIKSIKEFSNAFNYIYNLLTNFYKITYKPSDCYDLHNIKVTLDIPELNIQGITSNGEYDKSMFNKFSEIGTINLMDINFEYNKSTITNESYEILNDVAIQLKRNPDIKIKICGHTDAQGSDEYNLKLSEDRANSVKTALINLGINKNRIKVKGYGKTKPIAPNDTEENKKKNRRIEFIIIE